MFAQRKKIIGGAAKPKPE